LHGYKLEKIWDPVTRLWHWVLVLAVSTGWCFGKFMNFDIIQWHFYIGYLILGLLVFRYLWGFWGPAPVRYRALLPTPSATLAYLRTIGKRKASGSPGHNPLGSLSVIAMMLVITTQAVTGLFVESDDFFEYGPLAEYVEQATINNMTWWHHFIADLIFIVVVLHVVAILFHLLWKKENLIKPMINGWKWVKHEHSDTQDN
jgi:cytochrome b